VKTDRADLDPIFTRGAQPELNQVASSDTTQRYHTMKSLKSLGYAGGLVAAALLGGTL